MTELLFDALEICALHRGAKEIAKIRETCKEASQLPMLEERYTAEYYEWYIPVYSACIIQHWWRTSIPSRCRFCKRINKFPEFWNCCLSDVDEWRYDRRHSKYDD